MTFGLVALLIACNAPTADLPAPGWGVAHDRLGQPTGDFPSYDERVVLYATNRARSAPAAEGWPTYPAQPPLQWNYDLNRSARAHSQDMHDTPCFQHNSCDGTDLFVRIKTFYTGPWTSMGENISAGKTVSDGFVAVHNWIFEIGAPAGETGHRDNIFSAKFTHLGAGFVAGGTQYQNYWTQDFVGTSVTRPRLGDGIHFPATAAAGGMITFGTTYTDAAGAPPASIAVVVDGACTPLALAHGTAARGAYEAKLALPAGCHSYFFLSTTGGADATYPDVGALQVAVGGAADCPLAVPTRASNGCAAGQPDGGAGAGGASGSGGTSGASGGSNGAGGAGSDDDGGSVLPGSGGGENGGGSGGAPADDAGTTPPTDNSLTSSTFGCAIAGAPGPSPWAGLVLLGASLLAFLVRRPRRLARLSAPDTPSSARAPRRSARGGRRSGGRPAARWSGTRCG